jgi:hypothetical protein
MVHCLLYARRVEFVLVCFGYHAAGRYDCRLKRSAGRRNVRLGDSASVLR